MAKITPTSVDAKTEDYIKKTFRLWLPFYATYFGIKSLILWIFGRNKEK